MRYFFIWRPARVILTMSALLTSGRLALVALGLVLSFFALR
jgi:hypothetical protein